MSLTDMTTAVSLVAIVVAGVVAKLTHSAWPAWLLLAFLCGMLVCMICVHHYLKRRAQ